MDRARTEAIIQAAYDARDSGDIDAVMRFFAPGATFELVGAAATFPAAMRVQGEAGLRQAFGGLISEFQFLERTMLASVIEGDKGASAGACACAMLPLERTTKPSCSICGRSKGIGSSRSCNSATRRWWQSS
jgi:hypothetical protein